MDNAVCVQLSWMLPSPEPIESSPTLQALSLCHSLALAWSNIPLLLSKSLFNPTFLGPVEGLQALNLLSLPLGNLSIVYQILFPCQSIPLSHTKTLLLGL
jgi:hypothetical protein